MSSIAENTGIGRATHYKYFPDVESIFSALHQRHIGHHFEHLNEAGQGGAAINRLKGALTAYAHIQRERPPPATRPRVGSPAPQRSIGRQAQRELHQMTRELVEDAVSDGAIRDDIPSTASPAMPSTLSTQPDYAPSEAAASRLVTLTVAGMRPTSPTSDGQIYVKPGTRGHSVIALGRDSAKLSAAPRREARSPAERPDSAKSPSNAHCPAYA